MGIFFSHFFFIILSICYIFSSFVVVCVCEENVLRVADASFVSSCQQYTVTHYYNCDSNIGNYTAIVNDRIWLTCPNYIGCHEEAEQTAAVDPGQTSPNNSTCWILIQQNDGFNGQFFNRTWHSYRDGFGDASGNYWIGNQHLHQMTQLDNQACRLRVEVEIKASGEWLWAEYDSMSVESENDNYVLHVYGYQGNAGDAFNDDHEQVWQSNGMQFSTWDVDNDQLPGRNCAYDYGSGWWFRACSSSNLNTKKKRRWYSTGAYWYSKIRISASRMMLQCGTA